MKSPRRRSRTLGIIAKVWYDHLTIGGKSLVALLLICLPSLTAADSGQMLLFSASLSVLLIDTIVGWLFRPRLTCSVRTPQRLMCGQLGRVRVYLHNPTARPVYDLILDWTHPVDSFTEQAATPVGSLGGHASADTMLTVSSGKRGVESWPSVRATSAFPLQLVRFRQRFKVTGTLRVYPSFARWKSISGWNASTSHARESEAFLPVQGESWEYFGSREYQPGMPVRRWDFGSWARLGRPVVREFFHQREHSAAIAIDVQSVQACDDPSDRLEDLLSDAAALADYLTRAQRPILWVTTGYELLTVAHQSTDRARDLIFDFLAETQIPQATSKARAAESLAWNHPVVFCCTAGSSAPASKSGGLANELRRCGCEVHTLFSSPRKPESLASPHGTAPRSSHPASMASTPKEVQ